MAGTKRLNRRRRLAVAVLGTLALLTVGMRAHAADEAQGRIERIELQGQGSSTKVVITLSRPLAYDVHVLDGDADKKSSRRLVVDFANTTLAPGAAQPIAGTDDLLRQIRPGQFNARTARIVLDLGSDATHTIAAVATPPQVTIALDGPVTTGAAPAAGATTVGTAPTADSAAVATPPAAGAAADHETTAATVPPSTAAADTVKTPVRPIPIRARGRRPYALIY